MSIYTRSGDKGLTRIHGGERVAKDDIRIEALGEIDELNSLLGVVRSFMDEAHEWQQLLFRVQKELMVVMSLVATPAERRADNPNSLEPNFVEWMESTIDRYREALGEDSRYFILPGGNHLSAHLQLARAVARRAERRLWALNREDEVMPEIMKVMNRLSDLLFIMGRYELFQQGHPEEKWQHFLYKRKNLGK